MQRSLLGAHARQRFGRGGIRLVERHVELPVLPPEHAGDHDGDEREQQRDGARRTPRAARRAAAPRARRRRGAARALLSAASEPRGSPTPGRRAGARGAAALSFEGVSVMSGAFLRSQWLAKRLRSSASCRRLTASGSASPRSRSA